MTKLIFILLHLFIEPLLANNNENLNVGTVLFTHHDIKKSCWTMESLSLLTTRMLLEDLMPAVDSVVVDSDEYVSDLVDYFRGILGVVRQKTKGKRKHIVLLALTDILGGYLKSVVVPRTKYAYYAGLIDFFSVERVLQLYEEIKWFLRTNGIGWAKPIDDASEGTKVSPINMDVAPNNDSCDSLIFYSHTQKNKKTTLNPRLKMKDPDKKENRCKGSKIDFPIPFLDKRYHPNSIAVPFRYFTLRNLESKKASSVIYKYFVAVYTCMAERKVDEKSRKTFYDQFYTWLETDIIPKTDDEKFYAAFGGVFRVEETLRNFGAEHLKSSTPTSSTKEDNLTEEISTISAMYIRNDSTRMVCFFLIVLLFVWVLLATLFICFRIKAKRKNVENCGCSTKTSRDIAITDSDSRTLPKCSCTTSVTESKTKSTTEPKSPPETTAMYHLVENVMSLKLLPSIAEISEKSSKKGKLVYDSDEGSLTSESTSEESSVNGVEEQSKALAKISNRQFVKRQSQESITSSKKDSSGQSTDLTNSEGTSTKFPKSSSASHIKLDTKPKDSSDFSTDATSQIIRTASSVGKPAELRISYDVDETPGTSKIIPAEKRYCFGYDFQTSTSGESTSESEESGYEEKSNSL